MSQTKCAFKLRLMRD